MFWYIAKLWKRHVRNWSIWSLGLMGINLKTIIRILAILVIIIIAGREEKEDAILRNIAIIITTATLGPTVKQGAKCW